MNSLRCSNCSFLNFDTATACKRCGFQFEAAPAAEWEAHPYSPTGPPPPPAGGESFFWDQPSYQSSYGPPPASSGSTKGKAVAGAVVFAVAALIAFLAVPKLLKKVSKTNFAKVSWSEYRSPDKKFSISLPAPPKESVVYQQTPLGRTPVTVLEAQVSLEGGCMLMYADYPVGEKKISEDAIYEYALNKQGSLSQGFEIGTRKYILHDGYKGLEIELKSGAESKFKAIGVARLFWVSPRIYVLLSVGPETADFRAFQPKCHESFKLYNGT